jgi:hypothetical protein
MALQLIPKHMVDLPEATTEAAGLMPSAAVTKLNGIAAGANAYVHPSGDGNLHVPATGTANNGKVLKAGATAGSPSWGTLAKADVGLNNVDNTSDANKPISTATQTALNAKAGTAVATTSASGLMSSTDKTKLNGIAAGAQVNVGTNLNYAALTRLLSSSTGSDVTLPEATTSAAGLMSSSDKTKLNGLAEGGGTTGGTDLSYTASTRLLASSTGSDVTLPLVAADGNAGLMNGADKTKLDGVQAGANAYAHPTGDGNLHVPATGTTNSGKVLTAGATEGALSWKTPPNSGGGWELTPGSEIYMRQDNEVTYTGALVDNGYGDASPFGYGYDHLSGNWDGLQDDKFVAAFRIEAYGTFSVSFDVSANDGGNPGKVMAAIFLNGVKRTDFVGFIAPSTGYHTYTSTIISPILKPGDVIAVKITNGDAGQITKAKNVRILIADLTRA